MDPTQLHPQQKWNFCPSPPVCKITGIVLGILMISGGIGIYLKGATYFPNLFSAPRRRLISSLALGGGGILLEGMLLLNLKKRKTSSSKEKVADPAHPSFSNEGKSEVNLQIEFDFTMTKISELQANLWDRFKRVLNLQFAKSDLEKANLKKYSSEYEKYKKEFAEQYEHLADLIKRVYAHQRLQAPMLHPTYVNTLKIFYGWLHNKALPISDEDLSFWIQEEKKSPKEIHEYEQELIGALLSNRKDQFEKDLTVTTLDDAKGTTISQASLQEDFNTYLSSMKSKAAFGRSWAACEETYKEQQADSSTTPPERLKAYVKKVYTLMNSNQLSTFNFLWVKGGKSLSDLPDNFNKRLESFFRINYSSFSPFKSYAEEKFAESAKNFESLACEIAQSILADCDFYHELLAIDATYDLTPNRDHDEILENYVNAILNKMDNHVQKAYFWLRSRTINTRCVFTESDFSDFIKFLSDSKISLADFFVDYRKQLQKAENYHIIYPKQALEKGCLALYEQIREFKLQKIRIKFCLTEDKAEGIRSYVQSVLKFYDQWESRAFLWLYREIIDQEKINSYFCKKRFSEVFDSKLKQYPPEALKQNSHEQILKEICSEISEEIQNS